MESVGKNRGQTLGRKTPLFPTLKKQDATLCSKALLMECQEDFKRAALNGLRGSRAHFCKKRGGKRFLWKSPAEGGQVADNPLRASTAGNSLTRTLGCKGQALGSHGGRGGGFSKGSRGGRKTEAQSQHRERSQEKSSPGTERIKGNALCPKRK